LDCVIAVFYVACAANAGACSTDDDIIAVAAEEVVITFRSVELIICVATKDLIISGSSDEKVGVAAAFDMVVAGVASLICRNTGRSALSSMQSRKTLARFFEN